LCFKNIGDIIPGFTGNTTLHSVCRYFYDYTIAPPGSPPIVQPAMHNDNPAHSSTNRAQCAHCELFFAQKISKIFNVSGCLPRKNNFLTGNRDGC
jgi:hypothetical protein